MLLFPVVSLWFKGLAGILAFFSFFGLLCVGVDRFVSLFQIPFISLILVSSSAFMSFWVWCFFPLPRPPF